MATIERSFIVNVLVEKVFSYLSDFTKLPEWLPSLINVRGISGKGVGHRSSWTYKMMGTNFDGELECTEYNPNERLTIKTMGGITSLWEWTFKSQPKSTLANLVIKYNLPTSIIGFIASGLVLVKNIKEADTVVANIKHRLEWKEQFKVFSIEDNRSGQ